VRRGSKKAKANQDSELRARARPMTDAFGGTWAWLHAASSQLNGCCSMDGGRAPARERPVASIFHRHAAEVCIELRPITRSARPGSVFAGRAMGGERSAPPVGTFVAQALPHALSIRRPSEGGAATEAYQPTASHLLQP